MRIGISTALTDNNSFSYTAPVPLDPDAAIAALFETGTPGVYSEGAWYDPSDMSTMYQDYSGKTPVTAAGQPVGLILDKSKGLTLGAELVDAADEVADWSISGSNTITIDGDAIKISFVNSSVGANLTLTDAKALTQNLVAGKTYKFSCEAKVNEGDGVSVSLTIASATTNPLIPITNSTFQEFSFYFIADGSNETFRPTGMSAGEEFWIKNISVRELPGNHATQLTWAARPVLQTSGGLWYLDFDGVDDYLKVAWGASLPQPNSFGMGAALTTGTSKFHLDGYALARNTLYNTGSSVTLFANTVLQYNALANDGVKHVWMGEWNNSSSFLRKDGVLLTPISGSTVGPAASDGLTISARVNNTFWANNDLHALVFIDRALTAGEITDLESYLATKSGVTLP
jgi:hypothetical protein